MELLSSLRCLAHCLLLLATLPSQQHSVEGQLISENANLTFMLIISYGEFGFNSSGGLPAAEMALEDINSDPDMLPGYNLVYDRIRNSQVVFHHDLCTHRAMIDIHSAHVMIQAVLIIKSSCTKLLILARLHAVP